jgi:hypothetical protein
VERVTRLELATSSLAIMLSIEWTVTLETSREAKYEPPDDESDRSTRLLCLQALEAD